MGNPVEIRDLRNPAEWPAGAKPVTRKIQYDDLYRATRIDYVYSAGDDQWVSPFADEVASGGEATDGRRAPPSPHVAFDKRVLRQTFEYDWLGNTDKSGDDSRGFYDRSLGTIENATAGTPGVTEAKPYQLRSASNIEGAADGREGQLWTKYDVAGNLTRLDLRRVGPCLPSGDCSQRFEYRWDEVGRLERARRWDTSTNLGDVDGAVPAGTPAADLRYVYDASDQRILKEAVDAAGVSSHTLYLFPTLELRRAAHGDGFGYDGSPEGVADYEVDRWTAVPYLLANGVRLARLAYEETTAPSRDPAEMTGEDGAVNASTSQLHVFFELGDHLGSTSVVLDKATGELVERSTFLGYGATESDYRPSRWEGFREEYKFTGKEEDVEVGLQYFGKRFLNPYLGRWVSADPLAVHAPGEADLNVYAYVAGKIFQYVDPTGLDEKEVGWFKQAKLWTADKIGKNLRSVCDQFKQACASMAGQFGTGSKYWQQRLLDHYVDQRGERINLTLGDSRSWVQEVDKRTDGPFNPYLSQRLTDRSDAVRKEMKASGAASREFRWKGSTAQGFDGPGHFMTQWDIKVQITQDKDGSFRETFSGTMQMTDRWDFDPKPPGERPYDAELKTRLGQAISGDVFDIDSGELRVHGSDDTTVVIDGRAPKPPKVSQGSQVPRGGSSTGEK